MTLQEIKNNPQLANKIRIGALVLVVVIVAVVLIAQPFSRETEQIRDLREIGESEKGADQVTSKVESFLERERVLKDMYPATASSFDNTGQKEYNPFVPEEVGKEAEKAAEYHLGTYLSHESKLVGISSDIDFFFSHLYE